MTQASDMDALERYARAGETSDVALVLSAYSPDGVLSSPIVGRFTFRGPADIGAVMTEVYRVVKDTTFTRRAVEGRTAMLTAKSRVWGIRIEEAFAIDLDEDGRIGSATVHVRPWLGLTVFALALGLRMSSHPLVLWRAWRSRLGP
jgi:hypothetical protein